MANIIKIKRRLANPPVWDIGHMYDTPGEKVLYNGVVYIVTQPIIGLQPDLFPGIWLPTADVVNQPGAPASLLQGELAYNEVDGVLYYGSSVGGGTVAAVGGAGKLATMDTYQEIVGDKTFSSSVALSSATVSTAVTPTSSSVVANTEFVQNVFAIIDGGGFDSNFTTKYFYTASGSGDLNKWWNLLSWWDNNSHTISATQLPDNATNVMVLGSIAPYADIDRGDWVQPHSINTGTAGVEFYSISGNSITINIIGDATFSGNSTYNN